MLAIAFESLEVFDVFSQHHGFVDLPMTTFLLKFIQITAAADDERKLSLAMVDSTDQIRAKCDFGLADMESFLKKDMHRWEFVTDSKFTKVSTTLKKPELKWLSVS